MRHDALRSKILLLLGVPALSACKEATPDRTNEPTVGVPLQIDVDVEPPADGRFAQPPPGKGGGPAPLVPARPGAMGGRCGTDEVRELACGVVESPRSPMASPFDGCGATGDELASFGDVQTIRGSAIPASKAILAGFSFDAALTASYQRKYVRSVPTSSGREACCYSRCTRLDVTTAAPAGAGPGRLVRPTCVPAPLAGTSVPAASDPSCPAGLMLPSRDGSIEPVRFLNRVGGNCCYETTVARATCPSGSSIGPDGECQRHYRGRPIREGGVAVLAPLAQTNEWAPRALRPRSAVDEVLPITATADDAEAHRAAAKAWAEDAAAEHASIAAFSRLSLDLLALGAPADLVDAAHVAARDEIRHAQLAYGLASTLRGDVVGPGPLPLSHAGRGPLDLVTLARETFADGCVGETVAALEASELAAHAAPAFAEVLRVLAEEEAAHAALGFRIVAWAIDTGGDEVTRAIADLVRSLEAEAARDEAHAHRARTTSDPLARFGQMSEDTTRACRARAIDEVVLPCARALLAGALLGPECRRLGADVHESKID